MTHTLGQEGALEPYGAPRSVAVVGGGLALWLAALAMSQRLPESVVIHVVETRADPRDDWLYGTLLPPEIYGFHLEMGVAEPDFMQETETVFAFGTTFLDWADTNRSWVSAFHAPLPVISGVPLSKLVAAQDASQETVELQDCLISAVAARRGVFAHPPEAGHSPLSKAEYGYLADPSDLARYYRSRCWNRVHYVSGRMGSVEREGDRVMALEMADSTRIAADVWIDASGLEAHLAGPSHTIAPKIALAFADIAGRPGPPSCLVQSDNSGWSLSTPLRTRALRLSVGPPGSGTRGSLEFAPAIHPAPWTVNVVAIGVAAARFAPLTGAAMRLLLRDVQRLRDLFPVSGDSRIEAREYNAAHASAASQAYHYHLAHFADVALPPGPCWTDAAAQAAPDTRPPALQRKLRQYTERGYLVDYDHEPFDADSWAILHAGIGRRPRRSDALASAVPKSEAAAQLRQLAGGVRDTAQKMPPHPLYLAKFLDYLRRRAGTPLREVANG